MLEDYKNSFIFLVDKNNCLTMVKRTNEQDFNIPGGKRDVTDKDHFETMSREFREETNELELSFESHKCKPYFFEPFKSVVYYGTTEKQIESSIINTLNDEIDCVVSVNLKYLFISNEMISNKMISNKMISNKMISNEMILNETLTINKKPLRDTFISATKEMLKDNDFRMFIKGLL